MKHTKLVSDSEWQVLRVLWTLDHATSREVADHFKHVKNWEPATTKTLISRLVKKGYVKADTEGKAYVYRPTMTEQQGTQSRIMEAFDSICAQEVGNTLRNIIDHYDLSHQDKKMLLDVLSDKKSVDSVDCNCVVSCGCGQDNCTCKKA